MKLAHKVLFWLREFLLTFWGGFPMTWDEDCAEAVAETGEDG